MANHSGTKTLTSPRESPFPNWQSLSWLLGIQVCWFALELVVAILHLNPSHIQATCGAAVNSRVPSVGFHPLATMIAWGVWALRDRVR
jgi:hypothetical protein